MALLSSLVSSISAVTGLDDAHVTWVARHLRQAGLISQAGRGRGAAHMNVADAANLLIGINSGGGAKDFADLVLEYRSKTLFQSDIREHTPLADVILPRMNFGIVLEGLISGCIGRNGYNKFLPRDLLIYEGVLEWHPLETLDVRLEETKKNFGSFIKSSIDFQSPNISVSLMFESTGREDLSLPPPPPPLDYAERQRLVIASAWFSDGWKNLYSEHDQTKVTSITFKTIMEVGKVLAS